MAGRYLITETPYVTMRFNTLDVVTIDVYTMAGVAIVLPPGDDACTEIGNTGVFQWRTGLLPAGTISTTGMTKLLFVMTNGLLVAEDTMEWGGYPDLIVGLSQMNVYIDKCVYNATYGGLETARMRIYDTAVNVGTASGVIATLNLTAAITAPGQFSSWKQVKP